MIRLVIAAVALALAVTATGADDKVEPKSNEKIKKLQVELRDTLKKALTARKAKFEAGRGTQEGLLEVSQKLLEAELTVAARKEQRVAAHAAHLKVAQAVEELTTARYDAGRATVACKDMAVAARIEAEIGWLKAGGEEKKDRKDK
jgi:hypothetical protein